MTTLRVTRDMWFRMEPKPPVKKKRGRSREFDPDGLGCVNCPLPDCTWVWHRGKCKYLKEENNK